MANIASRSETLPPSLICFFQPGRFLAKRSALQGGRAGPHGMALSDDFRRGRLGPQWAFYDPAPDESHRLTFGDGVMTLQGKGTSPRDSSPLGIIAGDLAYQFEVEMEVEPGAQGGAVLFYNDRLYAGVGSNGEQFVMHRYGLERPGKLAPSTKGGKLYVEFDRKDDDVFEDVWLAGPAEKVFDGFIELK